MQAAYIGETGRNLSTQGLNTNKRQEINWLRQQNTIKTKTPCWRTREALDYSQSPIFPWDRRDWTRLTFNGSHLDFQMYRAGGRRGIILASPLTAPFRPLSSFDTHPRWQPVTQSAKFCLFVVILFECLVLCKITIPWCWALARRGAIVGGGGELGAIWIFLKYSCRKIRFQVVPLKFV